MVAASQFEPKILLVVSGGIAAYKAPEIVRAFVARGAVVQVVMTPAARAFVTEMALSTVSRHPVRVELLDTAEEGRVGHIDLADWPDLVVVAPATADLMARATHGLANDLATTVLLATRAPVLWAPAMNTNMWRHPATRANLAGLAERGNHFVGPDAGELACGWIGEGRMIDPPIIVERALALVESSRGPKPWAAKPWTGRRVVVSAGPTRAYLDPVRFMTNASTGAMGFALAEAAADLGAEVTLVAGPVELPTPPGVARVNVETAEHMLDALRTELRERPPALLAMVAAVADLAPKDPAAGKLEKGDLLEALRAGAFVQGVDVLATLTAETHGPTFFLAFGAQTVDTDDARAIDAALVEAGVRKMKAKGCPAIFVNRVGAPGVGFASHTNAGVLVIDEGGATPLVLGSGAPRPKSELARWLLDRLHDRVPAQRSGA